PVGTASVRDDALAAGPAVVAGSARIDARDAVVADELHVERAVVPAVVVWRTVCAGGDGWGRGVEPQREREYGHVAGTVGAASAGSGASRVGAGVGQGGRAPSEPGGRIGAAPADRDRVVVPAVRVRGSSRRR